MTNTESLLTYFSPHELLLWLLSVVTITVSFFAFDSDGYLTLAASLTGASSLIFCAKGNPFGQVLMVIFSVMYGIISYSFAYYGEMITYLGMTAPMSLFSLAAWLRHPYKGNRAVVKVNRLKLRELLPLTFLSAAVTCIFYFILKHFNTASLILSTVSVSTSFIAVYLTFRRSAFYAIGYAANDIVLIALWIIAAKSNTSYISVVVCFIIFLANDIYGFFSWRKMYKTQSE